MNADVVASQLAIELGAEKLVFVNDVPGVIGPTGDLLSELSASQCLELLARHGVVAGGMIPKLESAVAALAAGVGRVHMVDGRVEHSLVLELFTPEGVGTMVTPDAARWGSRRERARRDADVRAVPRDARRGAGARVWDDAGREYLDFAGALGVTALGHSHPDWIAAVRDQLGTLDMVSNLYATEPQAKLAERLASLMPVPDARVFFCNSGAEANEAAIKLVRKHGLASGKPAIVALEGSFHGRTVAALAATGQPPKRAAFEPLVDWFRFVPPNDLAALDWRDDRRRGGGAARAGDGRGRRSAARRRVPARRAPAVRRATRSCSWPTRCRSGIGRCGDWAALQHAGVEADVLTLAKALGGGLPIGAMLARAPISFEPGDHASTFGGGPVVCAGALAVLDTIERDGLLERARAIGESLPGAA